MNSRASLTVSMKILLMVTALILASTGSGWTRTTDLPHPWLTLDRSAKVLSLQCKPPEDASLNWRTVHDLRLTAFLPQRSTSNISLVTVTSNMKEPKVNDLFTIHRVTFQGSWPTVSVSLDFLFPVTDKELGRYFCTVHHSDKDDKLSTFTTEMVVNQDLVSSHIHTQPKNVNGFSVKVIEAHEVRVTWTKPESLKFTEASVSRMLADEEGTAMAPSMSLFSTNGVRQLVYNSDDVLLAKFNPQDSGNLSITLYVESDAHSRSYRYTCRVPYPACTGRRADSCTCCQGATNPDTRVCPTPPKDSQIFVVLFLISLILLLLFLTVLLAVCCVLKTRRSGTMANLLKSFITTGKSTPAGSKEQHKNNSADSEIGTSVERTHKHTGSRLQEAGEGWDGTHKHTSSRLQEAGEGWDGTHKHTSSRLQEAEEGWDGTHKHTSSRLQEAGEGWGGTHKHTSSRLQRAEEASQPQTDLRNDPALATVRQYTTSFSGAPTRVRVISGFSSDRTSHGEETPSASSPTDPLIPGDRESSGGKENQQPLRVHLPSEGTSVGKGLNMPHESLETVHETLTAHPTQEELGDRSLRPRPRYKSAPATLSEITND